MPLLDHLIELRKRLLHSAVAFVIAFVACYVVAEPISRSWCSRWPTSMTAPPTAA